MIETVGILYHPKITAALPLAIEIYEWLIAQGISAWHHSTEEEAELVNQISQASLLVVLGGDGSLLRATRFAAPCHVPVFGVNLGRVGFLSEAQPTEWREKLSKVLAGEFWEEHRLMIHATLWRDEKPLADFTALNDVVIGRGAQARVLRLHLRVDGDLVTTYTADALIVATPTGSTAYSMAAGGPLLPPQLQNFIVVPVAAHLSLDRPLVLHEEAKINIEIEMDHEANLTVDGQGGIALLSGDRVLVEKHENHACFARVESSGYFYRRLMRRLGYMRQQPEE